MRHWNYLQASFPPDDLDEASGILWSLGTNGIEEDPLRSDRLRIKAYFDPLQDLSSLHHAFKSQCRKAGISLFRCTARIQTQRDWFKKWRQQLQPFTVGKCFQIVPVDSKTHTASCHRHLTPCFHQRWPHSDFHGTRHGLRYRNA